MRNSVFLLLVPMLALQPLFVHTHAQEIDCMVNVNFEGVATTHKELLVDFPSDVKSYLNDYKWGSDNFDEKIKCTMNIFIKGAVGENRYTAQVFVGSQRPILGSEKSSAVMRLFDEMWEFTYVKNRPINHNLYAFNDLASFLDYYVYVILGYDYDTYEELGGTPHFQKAADVASLGRSSGVKGWQASPGSFSRVQLVDELLNPKFKTVRAASYTYHSAGLDSLALNPGRAQESVLRAIETIGKEKKNTDPRNLVIRSFFDAKYLELADVFVSYPEPNVYIKLGIIDPSHQTTYEQYRNRNQ